MENADMAIAVFWTKFGKPTTYFGSGTEEEIENMMLKQKQVFVYFLNKPVPPSVINGAQYRKIIGFKRKYRNKGICFDVKDERELEIMVEDGLMYYFSNT